MMTDEKSQYNTKGLGPILFTSKTVKMEATKTKQWLVSQGPRICPRNHHCMCLKSLPTMFKKPLQSAYIQNMMISLMVKQRKKKKLSLYVYCRNLQTANNPWLHMLPYLGTRGKATEWKHSELSCLNTQHLIQLIDLFEWTYSSSSHWYQLLEGKS